MTAANVLLLWKVVFYSLMRVTLVEKRGYLYARPWCGQARAGVLIMALSSNHMFGSFFLHYGAFVVHTACII